MSKVSPLHTRLVDVVSTIEREFGPMAVFAFASWAAERGYLPSDAKTGSQGLDVAGILDRIDVGARQVGAVRALWRRTVLLIAARATLRKLRNLTRQLM